MNLLTLLFTLLFTITGTDIFIVFVLEAIMFIALMVWADRLHKKDAQENKSFKATAIKAFEKSKEIPDYMRKSFMPMSAWFSDGKIRAMGKNNRYYELGKQYKTGGDGVYRSLKDCFSGQCGSFSPNSDDVVVCEVAVSAFHGSIQRNTAGEVIFCTATEFEILGIVPWEEIAKADIAVTNNNFISPERKQLRMPEKTLKGYKAFTRRSSEYDGVMNCKGRPFVVGETQTIPGRIAVCKNGLHFCTTVTDCFSYYGNVPSTIICEVEASGIIVKEDTEGRNHRYMTDSDAPKYCARTLRIVKELTRDEINELLESETPVVKSKTESLTPEHKSKEA